MKKYFCSHCGIQTKVKVPKGGDGFMVVPIRHKAKGFDFLCPGCYDEAKEINVEPKQKKKRNG